MGMDALQEAGIGFNKPVVLGIAIPLVMAGVFWGIRRVHHRFISMARRH
jgi:uncharacterized membrane-anchored protein